MLISEYMH